MQHHILAIPVPTTAKLTPKHLPLSAFEHAEVSQTAQQISKIELQE